MRVVYVPVHALKAVIASKMAERSFLYLRGPEQRRRGKITQISARYFLTTVFLGVIFFLSQECFALWGSLFLKLKFHFPA